MRYRPLSIVLLSGLSLVACASPVRVDGIPIYGRIALLPPAELRAVIAADRATPSLPENKIYALEIVSSTEVHVHHSRWEGSVTAYNELHRVNGKWHKPDERMLGSHPW